MGTWLVKRQLKGVATRLKAMRAELAVIDAGVPSLSDDADDSRLRAIVSGSGHDAAAARSDARHAEAHAARKEKLAAAIHDLERRQDDLLDKLSGGSK